MGKTESLQRKAAFLVPFNGTFSSLTVDNDDDDDGNDDDESLRQNLSGPRHFFKCHALSSVSLFLSLSLTHLH